MRFTLLSASTALAAGLLLSACSSGGSGSLPGSSQVAAPMGHHGARMIKLIAFNPDTKCPKKKYYLCVDISSSSSGPYVQFSECTSPSSCPPTYDLVASATITTVKGKSAKKKLSDTWSPSPGNPTYQYITELKPQKASKKPKFIDAVQACYYYYPSDCGSTYDVGLIPT